MSLLDYIGGNRKGKKAHRIEKEAMKDPFLAEALEGFDMVDDDHIKQIEALQLRIRSKAQDRRRRPVARQLTWALSVACVVALLITGGYQLMENPKSPPFTGKQFQSAEAIEIYVPSNFYESNKLAIVQHNIANARMKTDLPAENAAGDESPIDIYVPRQYYEKNKDALNKLQNYSL